ncbi:MAG: 16S rRNA (guanine(966)-N(2))-methyltransferase RsmD [Rhodospirillales bacterium]|nr:16S rRNA (guanine(966)-N(2))-methyltransferase RsmD [Rhodospirillales bacterium]
MIRIIAGKHRGRALKVPAAGVRPTAERAREALFNILDHGIAWPGFCGATVFDVFAGSGACGLEALSRGAAHAAFIDHDGAALQTIRRNAAAMGEARTVTMLKLDATRLPSPPATANAPGVAAFLDPPYESGLATPALHVMAMRHWLAEGAIAVTEVAAREPLILPPEYTLLDERVYGAARLVFVRLGYAAIATSAGSDGRD